MGARLVLIPVHPLLDEYVHHAVLVDAADFNMRRSYTDVWYVNDDGHFVCKGSVEYNQQCTIQGTGC